MVGYIGNIFVFFRNERNCGGVGWGGVLVWGWGVRWWIVWFWRGFLMWFGEEMILEESLMIFGILVWFRFFDFEIRFVWKVKFFVFKKFWR